MAQGQLPFQYEEERREFGMTAFGELPAYMGLAQVMKVRESIGRHLHVRGGGQGWSDAQEAALCPGQQSLGIQIHPPHTPPSVR